jgi:hypothetical protein
MPEFENPKVQQSLRCLLVYTTVFICMDYLDDSDVSGGGDYNEEENTIKDDSLRRTMYHLRKAIEKVRSFSSLVPLIEYLDKELSLKNSTEGRSSTINRLVHKVYDRAGKGKADYPRGWGSLTLSQRGALKEELQALSVKQKDMGLVLDAVLLPFEKRLHSMQEEAAAMGEGDSDEDATAMRTTHTEMWHQPAAIEMNTDGVEDCELLEDDADSDALLSEADAVSTNLALFDTINSDDIFAVANVPLETQTAPVTSNNHAEPRRTGRDRKRSLTAREAEETTAGTPVGRAAQPLPQLCTGPTASAAAAPRFGPTVNGARSAAEPSVEHPLTQQSTGPTASGPAASRSGPAVTGATSTVGQAVAPPFSQRSTGPTASAYAVSRSAQAVNRSAPARVYTMPSQSSSQPNAASSSSSAMPPARAQPTGGGRLVDRVALLALALNDGKTLEMIGQLCAPLSPEVQRTVMDNRAKQQREKGWEAVAQRINGLAPTFRNPYEQVLLDTQDGAVLADIRPQDGRFVAGKTTSVGRQLKELFVQMNNKYTHLKQNLSRSGRNSDGEAIVEEAFTFCGAEGRAKDVCLFFYWLSVRGLNQQLFLSVLDSSEEAGAGVPMQGGSGARGVTAGGAAAEGGAEAGQLQPAQPLSAYAKRVGREKAKKLKAQQEYRAETVSVLQEIAAKTAHGTTAGSDKENQGRVAAAEAAAQDLLREKTATEKFNRITSLLSQKHILDVLPEQERTSALQKAARQALAYCLGGRGDAPAEDLTEGGLGGDEGDDTGDDGDEH